MNEPMRTLFREILLHAFELADGYDDELLAIQMSASTVDEFLASDDSGPTSNYEFILWVGYDDGAQGYRVVLDEEDEVVVGCLVDFVGLEFSEREPLTTAAQAAERLKAFVASALPKLD